MRWFQANVRPKETWLDVGAHYGYTALALSHYVGAHGRVFAFEMLPRTAGCLGATKVANQLRQMVVVPFGLGNVDKLTRVDTMPSYRGQINYRFEQHGLMETGFLVALDRVWTDLCGGDDTVSGVKIDVQGFELETLRGMAAVLRKHRPKLAVELHAGVDRDEFLKLIVELGYDARARCIEPLPGEDTPQLYDGRNYEFVPQSTARAESRD